MSVCRCKNCDRYVNVRLRSIYDKNVVVGFEFECPVCRKWTDYWFDELEDRPDPDKNELPF